MSSLTSMPEWQLLYTQAQTMRSTRLIDLFQNRSGRAAAFSYELGPMYADCSKQFVDHKTIELLINLAERRGLADSIEQLFTGRRVNQSENKPALHTLLRDFSGQRISVEGIDVKAQVDEDWQRLKRVVHQVQSGGFRGATGQSFTDIVNLGIGGSDLGPRLACQALTSCCEQQMRVHFASTVDGKELQELLERLNPARTMFIVASKSFTTQETLANAQTAKEWLCQQLSVSSEWPSHFIGVSASDEQMQRFGIESDKRLLMRHWVGGRYSLWSAVGVSIALANGIEPFEDLLEGAYAMDQHYRNASFYQNIPVILALIDFWNSQFMAAASLAHVPYDYGLNYLPSYLQQLYMESNGKQVTQQGELTDYHTQPLVWGSLGSNAQHAFFQLLHQGTYFIPVEFVLPLDSNKLDSRYKHMPQAHALAQAQALMSGQSATGDRLYQYHPGNKPSTMVLLDRLDARSLGMLLACYEHRVYTQSVIWGVNAFDQWGVELGKSCAKPLMTYLNERMSVSQLEADPSTCNLAERIKSTVETVDFE